MRKSMLSAVAFLVFLFTTSLTPVNPATGEFVQFSLKNAGLTVEGKFQKFTTDVTYSAGNPSASVFKGEIEVASINTGIEMRDEHLRGEDYFHAAKYPRISFVSKRVLTRSEGLLDVYGTLTIKGVTKDVVISVKSIKVDGATFLEGSLVIDRRDYGVGGSSWIMGDDITCTIRAKAN